MNQSTIIHPIPNPAGKVCSQDSAFPVGWGWDKEFCYENRICLHG